MSDTHNDERQVFTIAQFCARNAISPFIFHKLKREGRGPKEMSGVGGVRISIEAERQWRKDRETPTDAEKRLIKREREARQKLAKAAAKASVKSPRHPSNRKGKRNA